MEKQLVPLKENLKKKDIKINIVFKGLMPYITKKPFRLKIP